MSARTVEIKGFIHARPSMRKAGEMEFCLWSSDMSAMEGFGVLVGPATFAYAVPDDFNPVGAQINALNKQLETANREFAAKVRKIKQQISVLEAIEFDRSVS